MQKIIYVTLVAIFITSAAQAQILIGIGGGTGSGKTTLAEKLHDHFKKDSVLLQQDSYYKDWSHLSLADRKDLNFDHPDSLDFELLEQHLLALKNNEPVSIPKYDFVTHSRRSDKQTIFPKKIIILEGILVLAVEKIRDLLDIRIYVDTNDDIRILRRMERDLKERGRSFESVKNQYIKTVKPMHNEFVEPSKQHADVVIHGINDNFDVITNLISGSLDRQHPK